MIGRSSRRLRGRADEAVDADVARLRGALGDQLRHGEVVAGGGEIGIVVGGEHRDGEDAQLRAGARVDRRVHGLRIGVHGEERRAELRDALDPARDRVADVVQLEVEEDLLAGAGQRAREVEPAREGELIADLVERHRFAEPRHHRLRRGDRGHVERDDQAFARIEGHGAALLMRTACAVSISLRTTTLSWRGGAGVLELVHLVEGLLGVRHRDLLGDHQRAAADRQHLPQRQQRLHARPSGRARRRRSRTRGSGRRRAAARRARAPPRSSRWCS